MCSNNADWGPLPFYRDVRFWVFTILLSGWVAVLLATME